MLKFIWMGGRESQKHPISQIYFKEVHIQSSAILNPRLTFQENPKKINGPHSHAQLLRGT